MQRERALTVLHSARRIGIVRTDRLGDMVLTLPLVRALHKLLPDASIEVICRSYVRDLVENQDSIQAVHYVDEHSLDYILQENIFDVLFFPRPVFSELWSAVKAAVPLRVGSAYRLYSALFSFGIRDHRKNAKHHEAEYNVRMLDALTNDTATVQLLRPYVNERASGEARELLSQAGIHPGEAFYVIHPGSGNSAQDWPAQNFGAAALALSQATGARIVLTGTKDESLKCRTVEEHCPGALNLCAKLDMPTLIALLDTSSLLLANSTGVLHVAASLDTPVVGLYPNSPAMSAARWGPYSEKSRVLSPPERINPARRDTMAEITVDSVVNSALELLQQLR